MAALSAGCASNDGAGYFDTYGPQPPALQAIHTFNGADGAWARGSLVRSGDTLFGRTSIGGSANNGTIFSVDTSGNNFRKIYDFTAGANNGLGNQPHHNSMLLLNQTLIGAALFGGDQAASPSGAGGGTLFNIGTDGSSYSAFKVFSGSPDAATPHSPPVFSQDGTTLYGLTSGGGDNNLGTIYSVNLDGSNFQVLYSFASGDTGQQPHGQLTYDSTGTLLLGMTRLGGPQDVGVVFSFDPLSANYNVLWTFAANDTTNGATNDHGFLTRIGTTLYGTTEFGGQYNKGIVFSMDESGSNFRIVHSFGADGDGQEPFGSLALIRGMLYATTSKGGASGAGTVFSINPSDNTYTLLTSFDTATTGANPEDNLTPDASGAYLFGQTQSGGVYDASGQSHYGTVFRLTIH